MSGILVMVGYALAVLLFALLATIIQGGPF